MGKLKRQVEAMRLVRRCWNLPEDVALNRTMADCYREGCPYAGKDCETAAIVESTLLAEKLWRKLQKARKKAKGGHE